MGMILNEPSTPREIQLIPKKKVSFGSNSVRNRLFIKYQLSI
uniref:Uncharacterized protein n=1 Tax=Anguilla anguilla TaxID=7936 RepID=A0A0E9SE34_ANGAN